MAFSDRISKYLEKPTTWYDRKLWSHLCSCNRHAGCKGKNGKCGCPCHPKKLKEYLY